MKSLDEKAIESLERKLSISIAKTANLVQDNIRLKEALEKVVIWNQDTIEFHGINDDSLKFIHNTLKQQS